MAQQPGGGASSSQAPAGAAAPGKPAAGTGKAKPEGDLKSDASYTIGATFGAQLHNLGLSKGDVSMQRIEEGLRDGLAGKAMPTREEDQKVMTLIRQARESAAIPNQQAAKKFLAENAKKPGVVSLPSGLQYKVIEPGSGDPPHPTDRVSVNYRGTLLDGKEFDSSYKRGMPATFAVNQVIKGWQEALVLMKPGAKWELYLPPELAYNLASPPGIPPGSLLKFDVELLKVVPSTPTVGPGVGAVPPGTAGSAAVAPGSAKPAPGH